MALYETGLRESQNQMEGGSLYENWTNGNLRVGVWRTLCYIVQYVQHFVEADSLL